MGFIILCIIYYLICKGVCAFFEIESFNKQALVYAIVGAIWRMIL